MDIGLDTIFTLSANTSLQSVGDGAVILLLDSGQLYTCNESSEVFLSQVDGQRSFAEIVRLFTAEFEVDEETAQADLTDLATDLLSEGIITVAC